MKVGIIGLRGSGKTTIFNSLTGHMVHSEGLGGKKGCALGLTKVPDKRIDRLSSIFSPKKTVYAQIHFTDFPGSTKDEKGFSDETLRKLSDVDALALVLKGFSSGVTPAPVEDINTVLADMILSDIILAERSMQRLEKSRQDSGLLSIITKIHSHLSRDRCLALLPLDESEEHQIAGYTFVTRKPVLVVLNIGEDDAFVMPADKVEDVCKEQGWRFLQICGSMEEEIAQLKPEDQAAFLKDLGVDEPARDRFIQASYGLLDLVSFFTVGDDEVRSWPIRRGTNAVKAAGKIHSDIERGFIRAEVIGYEDFIQCGDLQTARKKGMLRLEGKEYQVRDGDIITFRFNV
ncbi:redox-regulated ATPase YchF [bacterium]|nr:redox-regulated ATPase YchF [bacterium]